MSTGTLGQLKVLFCLLRKVRKRKQTLQERVEDTLTDLFCKYLGEKLKRDSAVQSLRGSGLNESSGCFARSFLNSTAKVLGGLE